MINVLYLDATRGLYGASRAMLTLLENIDRREVRPFVVLSNDVDDGDFRLCRELERLDIEYHEHPLAVLRRKKYLNPRGLVFMGKSLVRSTLFLRRFVRQHHIDIIQSNTSTVMSGAAVSALIRLPHIWHIHEVFRDAEAGLFTAMLRTFASRIVANSDATALNMLSHNPSLASRMVTIKNGIDPNPFRSVSEAQLGQLRREWGIGPQERVVGMIGRLGLGKGEDLFVEMARKVAESRENVRFVIVGGTFDNQNHCIRELQSQIDASGLGSRVLLAGLRGDIPAVVNLFDILVHIPRRPESFGLVAVEAMSAGKPVVAAPVGGLTEVVQDSETGFLVTPGDSQAAATKVIELLDDPQLCADMGRAGSRRVDALFSSPVYAAQFQDLYHALLSTSLVLANYEL